MDFNKKRIFIVVIISIILVVAFMKLNATDLTLIVKGEILESYEKEGDTEFNLENEASLRRKPDFSSKIIKTIEKGSHVQVLQELNKWVKITDGINEGWVVKQNVVTVEIDNTTTNESENNITANQVNAINNQTDNEVENKTDENNNSKNTISNSVKNETSNNVSNNTSSSSLNTTSNVGKIGIVNVDTARVREEPDGKMVGLVDLNDKVEILSEEGDWYKANIDEFENCYIAKRLVTVK